MTAQTLTIDEWLAIPPQYRTVRDGQLYRLRHDPETGETVLVPVVIPAPPPVEEIRTWDGRTMRLGDRVEYKAPHLRLPPVDGPMRGTIVLFISSGLARVRWDGYKTEAVDTSELRLI